MITAVQAEKLREHRKQITTLEFYEAALHRIGKRLQTAIKKDSPLVGCAFDSITRAEYDALADIVADYRAVGYDARLERDQTVGVTKTYWVKINL